ncbi:MAG: addiction module protein [Deltaproteobacteria bacterium]|nr:MAG: addiction module protein [Deltaproteobacteria bacterium]
MSLPVKKIVDEALQMPVEERARLAEQLISSLDLSPDFNTEVEWQKEIQKRLDEIKDNKVTCIPWEDVRRKLKQNARASH